MFFNAKFQIVGMVGRRKHLKTSVDGLRMINNNRRFICTDIELKLLFSRAIFFEIKACLVFCLTKNVYYPFILSVTYVSLCNSSHLLFSVSPFIVLAYLSKTMPKNTD